MPSEAQHHIKFLELMAALKSFLKEKTSVSVLMRLDN